MRGRETIPFRFGVGALLLAIATPAAGQTPVTEAPSAREGAAVRARYSGQDAGVGAAMVPLGLLFAGGAVAMKTGAGDGVASGGALDALVTWPAIVGAFVGVGVSVTGGLLWGHSAHGPDRSLDEHTEAAYDAGFLEGLGDGLVAGGGVVTGLVGLGVAIIAPDVDTRWYVAGGAGLAAMGTGGVLIWRGRAAADALTPAAPTATLVKLRF